MKLDAQAIVRSKIIALFLLSLFMPVWNCLSFDPSDNQISQVISINWPQKGGGPSPVARLPHYQVCWVQPSSGKWANVLLIFHLSNFPHHTQEEMLLQYPKLHSFLFYKFPVLSTLQISLYLSIQRNLFSCSLHWGRWIPVSSWSTRTRSSTARTVRQGNTVSINKQTKSISKQTSQVVATPFNGSGRSLRP